MPDLCPYCHTELGTWTDDPIKMPLSNNVDLRGQCPWRIVHIIEIRNRINKLEIENGLAETVWTEEIADDAISTPYRPAQILECRRAIERILDSVGSTKEEYFNLDAEGNDVGYGQTDWIDTDLTIGTPIRGFHIEDLRHVIPVLKRLKEKFSTSSNSTLTTPLSNYSGEFDHTSFRTTVTGNYLKSDITQAYKVTQIAGYVRRTDEDENSADIEEIDSGCEVSITTNAAGGHTISGTLFSKWALSTVPTFDSAMASTASKVQIAVDTSVYTGKLNVSTFNKKPTKIGGAGKLQLFVNNPGTNDYTISIFMVETNPSTLDFNLSSDFNTTFLFPIKTGGTFSLNQVTRFIADYISIATDINTIQATKLPLISSGAVTGVWLTSDTGHTGTNYFTGGSYVAATGVVTLGTPLPDGTGSVLMSYSYLVGPISIPLVYNTISDSEDEFDGFDYVEIPFTDLVNYFDDRKSYSPLMIDLSCTISSAYRATLLGESFGAQADGPWAQLKILDPPFHSDESATDTNGFTLNGFRIK